MSMNMEKITLGNLLKVQKKRMILMLELCNNSIAILQSNFPRHENS